MSKKEKKKRELKNVGGFEGLQYSSPGRGRKEKRRRDNRSGPGQRQGGRSGDKKSESNQVKQKWEKANIGWLFSKDYYREVEDIIDFNKKRENDNKKSDKEKTFFEEKNVEITLKQLSNYKPELDLLLFPGENIETFDLTTIYPGLFTGSGIPHEAGLEGEFKLGFFFDHTTGLPIIPGSSVKGVLRSAFRHPKYINYLLEDISENDYSDNDIKELKRQIFEGEKESGEKDKKGDPIYIPLPFSGRDIFFDAVIVESLNEDSKFLDIDFITPHKNDEFKDPVPLQFLKILPGVTFCFQFILNNGLEGKITAGIKKDLFKRILQDIGIGAKTNVGYGKFE